MNPQEEQQAQTIADARKWAAEESAWLSRQELPQSESVEHMDGVLQIVDSQAQKIAELTALSEHPNAIMQTAVKKMIELESQLSEARKEAHLYRTNFCMAARAATDDFLLPWEGKP